MLRFIGLTLVALLHCSCVRTEVSAFADWEGLSKLAGVNKRPINLVAEGPSSDSPLGHQYLLFFIPFGRIVLPESGGNLFAEPIKQLALAGFRPLTGSDQRTGIPIVRIRYDDLSVSAYDFFVTRRIVVKVKLSGDLLSPDGATSSSYQAEASVGELYTYGFKPQLERCLNKALEEVSADLVSKLFGRPIGI